jgi:hypothetical protein
VPEFRRALYACDTANSARVTLDIAKLRFRRAGLGTVVEALHTSRDAGGRLQLIQPFQAMRRFFDQGNCGWLMTAPADTEGGEPMPSEPYPETATLDQTRDGMTVIDANGDELGTVAAVAHRDPDAALSVHRELIEQYERASTAPPISSLPGGLYGPANATTGRFVGRGMPPVGATEPTVPPELAEQLLRTGYIKVDSKGFFHRDRYAAANQLDRVEDNTVYLNAPKNDLAIRA